MLLEFDETEGYVTEIFPIYYSDTQKLYSLRSVQRAETLRCSASLSLRGFSFFGAKMVVHRTAVLLGLLVFLQMHFSLTMSATDCPLDLSGSNFTLAASICSNREDRAKCCRYINAFIAVSIARYANITSNLGVGETSNQICLSSISETLARYGVTRNVTLFCGFGTKIPVNYECQGRSTVTQMLQSPKFADVTKNCKGPLSAEGTCRTWTQPLLHLQAKLIMFQLLTLQVASLGFKGFLIPPASEPAPSMLSPNASPTPLVAASPSQVSLSVPLREKHRPYRLTLIPGLGIAVTAAAVMTLVALIFLIRRKSRELGDSDIVDKASSKAFTQPPRKFPEGPSSMFRKFGYKETKKATDNFNTIVGQGGFGTVFRAQFGDGSVAAVKRMDKVSEQAEDEFCREIDLLARLHHRHLVALRGYCIGKRERFLVYEYMANGSLKDHLHTPGRTPLSWQTRIQIAIDVANALEYLHFYCDPPLCHRDIKAGNDWKLAVAGRSENASSMGMFGERIVGGHEHGNPCAALVLLEFVGDTKGGKHGGGDIEVVAVDLGLGPTRRCTRGGRGSGGRRGGRGWRVVRSAEEGVGNGEESKGRVVADFGLAHASKDGSICFEPVNTDIRGTPGYMDPEYVVTQELTEKSDIYSYGVVLLELVTARRAIQDNKNLVEWSQVFMNSESRLPELVDPNIGDSIDLDQLETIVAIVRWCTQREGKGETIN
ncbi:protein kinase superfamily protein [Actinidia rufa]|uniref:Protein kinase superfamily protein n=1 Tax=Actinidia rufa TaxID=165716 RepID=A0A7J0DS59_9ERIC|nr:protein kinase superfamily protein [Actinidia rufa]